MEKKKIIKRKRVRKIEGSFSWIDHRFITQGFINDLSTGEILLYLFLVSVSDRNGLSFYHDDRICNTLKIDLASLGEARQGLSLGLDLFSIAIQWLELISGRAVM